MSTLHSALGNSNFAASHPIPKHAKLPPPFRLFLFKLQFAQLPIKKFRWISFNVNYYPMLNTKCDLTILCLTKSAYFNVNNSMFFIYNRLRLVCFFFLGILQIQTFPQTFLIKFLPIGFTQCFFSHTAPIFGMSQALYFANGKVVSDLWVNCDAKNRFSVQIEKVSKKLMKIIS